MTVYTDLIYVMYNEIKYGNHNSNIQWMKLYFHIESIM